jgi:hypothetical protein
MLRDEFASPGDTDPGELRAAYERVLAETVEQQGVETVAAETGVDEATLTALVDGESPDVTLHEPGEYKGQDDPFLEKAADPEHQQQLQQRLARGQTDR